MTRRRVLVVTVWFPTPSNPVAQTFVRSHARAAAVHHDVTVLHLVEDHGATGRGMERLDDADVSGGLEVWRVRADRLPGEPGTLARLRAAGRSARILAQRNSGFDLVHAHMIEAGPPAWRIARRAETPWILTEHYSGYALGELSLGQRWKVRHVLSRAALVMPVSRSLQQDMANQGLTAPTRVVPNPVDVELFHPPTSERPPGPPRLLAVGRLHPVKGFDLLLQALTDVPGDLEWSLAIVGDGPQASELQAIARHGRLADRVTFHGALSPAAVAERMREADLLVAPSRHDTRNAAIAEAATTGLPTLATDVGGIPEVIAEADAGWLVSPGDVTSWTGALARQLAEPPQAGPASRLALARRAAALWSLDAVGDRLREIYEGVLTS